MKNYHIVSFDVKTAFLYDNLDDDVYKYPPERYKHKEKILKLNKALYGLKQAPVRWNKRFTNFLKDKDLKPLETKQCLFKKINSKLILGIYIDDRIVVGKNSSEIEQIIKNLKKKLR